MAGQAPGGQTTPPNINSLAAQGIQGAGLGSAAGIGYSPLAVGATNVSPSQFNVTGTNVTPTNVTGTNVTPTNITAGQLGTTNLNPYLNPYTTNVIDAQQADILRGANIGLDQLGVQAQMAGGFGGSRHGIAMSEMGRGVADLMGQQASGLRQANYQQAQQGAMQDIMNKYNADLANQQAGLQGQLANQQTGLQAALANQSTGLQGQLANQQVGLQGQLANQQTGMQGALANQNAQLQAQLANQGADLSGAGHRLTSAGQLGQMANLGFGMGQTVAQNLATQGAMQQALQQAVFDKASQKYAQYTGHPAQSLQYLNDALGVTPKTPQTVTSTKTPGLFDYLTLGASMKAGQPYNYAP
jgi:hypothetical protein